MALAAFLASSAPGQAPNESVPPPQVAELPLAKNQIRIRANEVIVPVTVTDRNSELVLDLSQKDFHVFDNGVEQIIDHWDLGGDPLAVALVLETSSHIQAMMPVIHSMGSIFTETVMALNGEAALITYDAIVDVRQPLTQDHEAVEKAIAKTEFIAPEMKLYDAMAAAVQLLKAQPLAGAGSCSFSANRRTTPAMSSLERSSGTRSTRTLQFTSSVRAAPLPTFVTAPPG